MIRLMVMAGLLVLAGCEDGGGSEPVADPSPDDSAPSSTPSAPRGAPETPSVPSPPPPEATPQPRDLCAPAGVSTHCFGDTLTICEDGERQDFDCVALGYEVCSWWVVVDQHICGFLRPEDAPDVVIVGVSGHRPGLDEFGDLHHNPEYLYKEGTLHAVSQPFKNAGFEVLELPFADELYDKVNPEGEITYGFLSLLNTLFYIEQEWQFQQLEEGALMNMDAPVVIVVAHSHGTVWAHLALHVLEAQASNLIVDVLVDLDGVCFGWESPKPAGDHWTQAIQEYNAETGTTWPFDISNPCDNYVVPGVSGLQDIEDIAPDLVVVNLEVAAAPLALPGPDKQPNHRLDGTTENIFREQFSESHKGVRLPGSDAMNWVVESVKSLYGL